MTIKQVRSTFYHHFGDLAKVNKYSRAEAKLGMITATLLGIFFTPVFYVAVRTWVSRKMPKDERDMIAPSTGEPTHA